MADESVEAAPVQEPAPQPEPEAGHDVGVELPPMPEFKPREVDLSGYDEAIKAQKQLIERAAPEETGAIQAEIARLEKEKTRVAASATNDELEFYRKHYEQERERLQTEGELAKILKGTPWKPEQINGSTPAEKLAAAKNLVALAKPADPTAPTPEQVAAHGTPMVPNGPPAGHDSQKNIDEAIQEGNLRRILDDPAYQEIRKQVVGSE